MLAAALPPCWSSWQRKAVFCAPLGLPGREGQAACMLNERTQVSRGRRSIRARREAAAGAVDGLRYRQREDDDFTLRIWSISSSKSMLSSLSASSRMKCRSERRLKPCMRLVGGRSDGGGHRGWWGLVGA